MDALQDLTNQDKSDPRNPNPFSNVCDKENQDTHIQAITQAPYQAHSEANTPKQTSQDSLNSIHTTV